MRWFGAKGWQLWATSAVTLLSLGSGPGLATFSGSRAAVRTPQGAPRRVADLGTSSAFLPFVDKTSLSAVAGDSGFSGGIVATDGYAYVGDGQRVAVVDVSDPSAPRLVQRLGPIAEMCEVLDLAQEADRVYALCLDRRARLDRPGPRGAVAVMSTASLGERAELLGTVSFDPMPFGLAAVNGWVYVSFRDCVPPCRRADVSMGILVIDARVGLQPTTMGTVETHALTQDLVVHDRALLALGGVWLDAGSDEPDALGVSILDLADPAAPRLAARAIYHEREPAQPWSSNFWCASIALHGSVGLIVDEDGNFRALDASRAETPSWLGHHLLEQGALAVTVSGDHPVVLTLSVVAGLPELLVLAPIEAAEPGMPAAAPEVLGRVELPREPLACYDIMGAEDGLVFVVDPYAQDMYVVDVNEPAAPALVGRLGRGVPTGQAAD